MKKEEEIYRAISDIVRAVQNGEQSIDNATNEIMAIQSRSEVSDEEIREMAKSEPLVLSDDCEFGFIEGFKKCRSLLGAGDWISVEERLPTKKESEKGLLVFDTEDGVAEANYCDKKFEHPYYGQTISDYYKSVTHWREKPTPPKHIADEK